MSQSKRYLIVEEILEANGTKRDELISERDELFDAEQVLCRALNHGHDAYLRDTTEQG